MAVVARPLQAHHSFERMYRRHVSSIYRYTLAVLGNEADAEDATQQTFLSAYRSWDRGERPRRPHNWLITIAHNVCRQRFRERSRRPAEVVFDAEDFPSPEVDQQLGAAEIRSALEQLAFNQRAALVMRELGGISYRGIAASLGVSEAAVETLLFRARRALREQLDGDLTCGEAEAALSRRLDGMLPRSEAGQLRAHLRACQECATLERSMRARRGALRGLAFPLPPTLTWSSVPSAVGTGLLAKGAAVVAVSALAAGVGTNALERARPVSPTVAAAAPSPTTRDPARPGVQRPGSAVAAPRKSAQHSIRPAAPRRGAARPRHAIEPAAGDEGTTRSAAPIPVVTKAIPVAAPAAAPTAPTVETLVPVPRSSILKPLGDGPATETSAVVGTIATVVTSPVVEAVAAAAPPANIPTVTLPTPPVPPLDKVTPNVTVTPPVPPVGDVTESVKKLTTP